MRLFYLITLVFFTFSASLLAQEVVVITNDDLLGDSTYYWTADKEYLLDGHVYLEAGGELNIAPGTLIRGRAASGITTGHATSRLIITRDARIFADGTPAAPIIFTAEADDLAIPYDIAEEEYAQWGGIAILGRANVTLEENRNGETIAFFTEDPAEQDLVRLGGGLEPDTTYSAGSFSYVSIRYAGESVGSQDAWGLLLGALGTGTNIHHVETIFNAGRGVMVNGGTVNLRYMVSAYNDLSGFHFWQGYRGKGQFWLSHQNGAGVFLQGRFANDLPGATRPRLANVSIFGSVLPPFGRGAFHSLTDDATGSYRNFLTVNAHRGCFSIHDLADEGEESAWDKLVLGTTRLENNHYNDRLGSISALEDVLFIQRGAMEPLPLTSEEIAVLTDGGNTFSTEHIAGVNENDPLYFDPVPFPGSSVLTQGIPINEPWFEAVNYQGAFGPDDNWLTWTFLGSGEEGEQFISGTLRRSSTGCGGDNADPAVPRTIIRLQRGEQSFFTTTDRDGNYLLRLPVGSATIAAIRPSEAWRSCPIELNVIPGENVEQDLFLTPLAECALPSVSISSAFLRRGFENTYHVSYANRGSAAAENPRITVTLAPGISFVSADLPLAEQVGDTLFFDLPALPLLQVEERFQIQVFVAQEIPLDSERCVSASITADNICAPTGGPKLSVNGSCVGDSIVFQVTNIGDEPTPGFVPYVVIEDEVMLRRGNLDLNPGENDRFSFPAGGQTFHFSTLAHPDSINPGVAAVTLSCAEDPFTQYSLFPTADSDPQYSIDCQIISGSYDPNDKLGLPFGRTKEQIVPPNITMDYRIRFQNTGTDTAFAVTVIDTLSEWLDPASIQLGASSHPYTWTLEGERTLKVTFSDIILPDSNANQLASNGFFKFRIKMVTDLPDGTALSNAADIYFDGNEPVRTNTTLHHIGRWPGGATATQDVELVRKKLLVIPQPARDRMTFSLASGAAMKGSYAVYSAGGQLLGGGLVQGEKVTVQLAGYQPGLYVLVLRDQRGNWLAGKRFIVQ